MRMLLILSLVFSNGVVLSQDYLKYHEQVNQALAHIAESRVDSSIITFNQAFSGQYEPFARDVYVALQVAAFAEDMEAFYAFMDVGVRTGITVRSLKCSRQTLKVIQGSAVLDSCNRIAARLHARYVEQIDTLAQLKFTSNFNHEQQAKQGRGYAGVVRSNFQAIEAYIKDVGFPSERRIGVDPVTMMYNSAGLKGHLPGTLNEKVTVTLLHFPYAYSKLEEELFKALHDGHIHPQDLAYTHAFERSRMGALYSNHSANDELPCRLNYAFEPKIDDYEWVEADRKFFGLVPLRVEEGLKPLAKEYGFIF